MLENVWLYSIYTHLCTLMYTHTMSLYVHTMLVCVRGMLSFHVGFYISLPSYATFKTNSLIHPGSFIQYNSFFKGRKTQCVWVSECACTRVCIRHSIAELVFVFDTYVQRQDYWNRLCIRKPITDLRIYVFLTVLKFFLNPYTDMHMAVCVCVG